MADRTKGQRMDPIYGVGAYFDTSDLPRNYAKVFTFLTTVSVNTTSAAQSTGARSIEIHPKFSDAVTSCDILVYRVDPGPTDTLVATFTGVTNTNADGLFVGNQENIDLKGFQTKIRAQNFAGGGTVTVTAVATS